MLRCIMVGGKGSYMVGGEKMDSCKLSSDPHMYTCAHTHHVHTYAPPHTENTNEIHCFIC